MLLSRITKDVRPVADNFSNRLSSSCINLFKASILEKFGGGGGVGDLYTLVSKYFFFPNFTRIDKDSKIFSRKGDRFFL